MNNLILLGLILKVVFVPDLPATHMSQSFVFLNVGINSLSDVQKKNLF